MGYDNYRILNNIDNKLAAEDAKLMAMQSLSPNK